MRSHWSCWWHVWNGEPHVLNSIWGRWHCWSCSLRKPMVICEVWSKGTRDMALQTFFSMMGYLLEKHCHASSKSIEAEVYSLVLDAGGNNAWFASMLHDLEKLPSFVWLDDESCYIDNWKDSSRRIYFWFCSTQVFKATRNQLKSSNQSEKKAF